MSNELPEGYEYAEVSDAKDTVYNLLDSEVLNGRIEEEDSGGPDLIHLADRIVEELLAKGAIIPAGFGEKETH